MKSNSYITQGIGLMFLLYGISFFLPCYNLCVGSDCTLQMGYMCTLGAFFPPFTIFHIPNIYTIILAFKRSKQFENRTSKPRHYMFSTIATIILVGMTIYMIISDGPQNFYIGHFTRVISQISIYILVGLLLSNKNKQKNYTPPDINAKTSKKRSPPSKSNMD